MGLTTVARPVAAGVRYNRGLEIKAATLAAFHDFVHTEPVESAWRARDEWRRCVVNLHALEATKRYLLGVHPDDFPERDRALQRTTHAIAGENQALANIRYGRS